MSDKACIHGYTHCEKCDWRCPVCGKGYSECRFFTVPDTEAGTCADPSVSRIECSLCGSHVNRACDMTTACPMNKQLSAVRVGSVDLCTRCWIRDGHAPDCPNNQREWFFVELQPYRNFIITNIVPASDPEEES